ncbi:MAG: hypothetical protein ACYCWN_07655 [Ferrimicrobium sp.]
MKWQKRPEGRPPRSLKSGNSLVHQSWRSIAADQLEATNRALGEMIETFETLNTTAEEIGDGLKAINADLRVILGDVSGVAR